MPGRITSSVGMDGDGYDFAPAPSAPGFSARTHAVIHIWRIGNGSIVRVLERHVQMEIVWSGSTA